MAFDDGEMRVFNPDKQIAIEVTLEIIKRHRNAFIQARTGERVDKEESLTDNERCINRAKALNLIISAQKDLITNSRAIVRHNAFNKWRKKYKDDEEQEKNPFEKFESDYGELMYILELLNACEMDILEAERTKSIEDDFMLEKDTEDGKKYVLTMNFYDMLKELEESYEKLYLLMLKNKIVSAGVEEDEEITYKQQEEEAIKRILDA